MYQRPRFWRGVRIRCADRWARTIECHGDVERQLVEAAARREARDPEREKEGL